MANLRGSSYYNNTSVKYIYLLALLLLLKVLLNTACARNNKRKVLEPNQCGLIDNFTMSQASVQYLLNNKK